MARFQLRVCADRLAARAEVNWPACNRVLYVREGDARIGADRQVAGLAVDSAWYGAGVVAVSAGTAGATLLRWELVPASAPGQSGSTPVLARDVDLDDPGGYLMRCDRVDFPPGGIAYTHVHRGPGIRCLLHGSIRVEVNGAGHDIAPGGAWFEAGPDPVLALASKTERTAFARVMILPRELLGKSSIRYTKAEDADKPKLQTYRVYVDQPIELP